MIDNLLNTPEFSAHIADIEYRPHRRESLDLLAKVRRIPHQLVISLRETLMVGQCCDHLRVGRVIRHTFHPPVEPHP